MGFEGRTALVTGAGSGIGKAIAMRFAAAGCCVAAGDIDIDAATQTVDQINVHGHRAVPVHLDVADESSVAGAVRLALVELDHIDILANVAGIWIGGTVTETSVADWDRVIGVNLRGPFLCSRAVLPGMIERRYGVILNVASITAFRVTRRSGAYNPSKAGLVALTKVMALDYAPYQIRVSAICPGGVSGTQMEAVTVQYRRGTPDETYHQGGVRQPLGRRGRADEIAAAALYLASDDAQWVTGSCLVIDGGVMAGL